LTKYMLKEKRISEMEPNTQEWWDSCKRCNVDIMGTLEGKTKREDQRYIWGNNCWEFSKINDRLNYRSKNQIPKGHKANTKQQTKKPPTYYT
jgi:hypothetical protein